jgi:hypothetical protein
VWANGSLHQDFKVNILAKEFHLQMKSRWLAANVEIEKRRTTMAEIGQPERVVRRERENEPTPAPVPLTSPALEPAQ